MSERAPSSYTVTALGDPTIEPGMLEKVARVKPGLRKVVLAHPNCSAELAEWIYQQPAYIPKRRDHTPLWRLKVGIALGFPALVGLIGLFLPLYTGFNYGEKVTLNYLSPMGMRNLTPTINSDAFSLLFAGIFNLGGLLIALASAIVVIVTRKKWAQITAGVIGIAVGFQNSFVGSGMVVDFGEKYNYSLGSGAVLVYYASLFILLAGIIALLPARKVKA